MCEWTYCWISFWKVVPTRTPQGCVCPSDGILKLDSPDHRPSVLAALRTTWGDFKNKSPGDESGQSGPKTSLRWLACSCTPVPMRSSGVYWAPTVSQTPPGSWEYSRKRPCAHGVYIFDLETRWQTTKHSQCWGEKISAVCKTSLDEHFSWNSAFFYSFFLFFSFF